MNAIPNPRKSNDDQPSKAGEIRGEQGFADWAYERLDCMLETALDPENAGVHAAAAHALWQMRKKRANLIRAALADRNGVLIGRLDMTDQETWYIGRHSVDGDEGCPAVIDWRAELASQFYQANRTFPGNVGRRRTIRMTGRQVTNLSDETLVAGFTPPAALPAVSPPPVPVQRRSSSPILASVRSADRSAEPEMLPVPTTADTVVMQAPTAPVHRRSAPPNMARVRVVAKSTEPEPLPVSVTREAVVLHPPTAPLRRSSTPAVTAPVKDVDRSVGMERPRVRTVPEIMAAQPPPVPVPRSSTPLIPAPANDIDSGAEPERPPIHTVPEIMADQPPPVPVLRARSSTPRILPNVDTATKPELLPVPIAPEIMAIEQPAVRVQRRPLPPIPASEADENQDGADEDEPPAGSPDPELRAGDLLLEDLARHRTGALADIVATIQADQDRLVRAPLNIPLVIQGGPGTGKTIVGLHRAAWVLYQQREQMTDQSVLIVGPNRRFIEYISSVLPSLGETAVRQLTIDELALDSLSTVERDRVRIAFLDTREVARVKGDVRMASVIWAAVWLPVVTKELSFGFGRYILRLNEDLVDEIISKIRRRGTPYRDARRELSEALAHAFADEYVRRLGRRGPSASGQELKQLIAEARSHLTTSGDLAGIQPAAEPRSLLRRLYEDPKFLDEVGVILTPTERRLLFRAPTRGPSASAWTAADMALLDEAAACIRGEPRTSGHVVVDEAQDLSPMQWRVLARRTSHASMTIMGDLGQATSPWSPASWTSVIDNAGLTGKAQIAELTLGYRVPKQVMDFAAPLLAIAAPSVTVPKSFRSTEAPLVRRAAASAVPHTTAELARNHQGEGAVAIIAPIGLHERIRTSLGDAGSGVSLLAPEASKGLEFDTVVVVEPEAIAGKTLAGLRLLYVSLTRATTKLIVVHSTTLPGGIGSDKPVTPSSYPNPRNDDPWDNDVVHWLLEQPGGESWTCGVLIECLRRRLSQVTRNPERVDDAARFAKRHGVVQDTAVRGNGSITRLFRTDPLAPTYPSSDADRRRSRGPKAGV